ncbi:unnamed protein product [Brassica napus]|uniref:Defective in cullin neddylation protein n=1 Tax=Brassica napus TaxID=3708 RepID=A0A817ABK2_BRANA|nr:unnamed protein product [Brassica napus]
MLCIKRFCFVMTTIVSAAPLTDLEKSMDNLIEVYHKYSNTSSNLIESTNTIIDVFHQYSNISSKLDGEEESIDIKTTCQLLDMMVMGSTFRPQVDYFVEYLKFQNDYKVINLDQWMGFYRFCNEATIDFVLFVVAGEHLLPPRIIEPNPSGAFKENLIKVYHMYSNTRSNLIDPEGIEKLCSDLDVSRTDIRFLMLAWTMKAEKQGYITHEEWTRGLKALRADTIDELKKALPLLEKEVRTPSNFADFYAYAFRYSLTEEKQEGIDIETICQLLGIVLGSTFRPQVDYFVEYLKIQNDYKVINIDQWMGFYRFCNEISFPEMTEYNPELAWPLLLNNFWTLFSEATRRCRSNGRWIQSHLPPRTCTVFFFEQLKKPTTGIINIFHHEFLCLSRAAAVEQALQVVVDVFHRYSNTASNLMDPEGIELLCSDLDVSRTDIRFLMLAWKMKAEKQGYYTQEEWTRGLVALGADTLDKLKKALPGLEKEVRTPLDFADFYAYAFRYSLTEEEEKSVDIETICQLLDMVMGSTFRPQVDYFVDYLKIQNDYKVITMDQWMGFYRFCNEISFPEMTEYNPGLAWPLLLNNFVEWIPTRIDITNVRLEKIVDVFYKYTNTSSNLIDPQGIELLSSDLDVSHTDVRILMLAWKMKAEKQGYFTQEEWTRGLMALRADTLSKLKNALPELEKEVRRPSNFADFYAYSFTYSLTEEKQESIDIETICQLLDTVMGSTFRPQVDYFVEYLKIQNDYKVINMDQWMGFYRFCNEISFPEMTEYNPELAWPLVLNNFVEWIREKQA